MNHGASALVSSNWPQHLCSLRRSTVKIVIADLDSRFPHELTKFLREQSDFEVAARPSTPAELLQCLDRLDADVLLVSMVGRKAEHLAPVLHDINSRTNVMAFVTSADTAEFGRAMRLGCAGVAAADTVPELIAEGIRHLREGRIWIDCRIATTLAREFAHAGERVPKARGQQGPASLSERERQLVWLVVQGYRNVGIAEKLRISEQTVKNHLHSIFAKLGVSDRLELALYAIHNGFRIEDDPAPSPCAN